ncbi:DUF6529 family protein [Streptomyces nojiriensis]|uniref:Cytochrome b561 domain-containing protein n=1 Tax=Streptomyces nojiriensis TaxID=66374 RepID=A0ABQ3SNQ2_9ACTN|nr:DUF6529 family protein [Streptomyces nojiriensis]QTI43313.1 hypothetical protein JYK04_01075 [Streptomyces nojiriensis]GGS12048.1 hypothetical protein GCM10010205_47170 [Streptomyces nojiriensis]GHI69762.1 hypothetical protein Snoj_36800 [Streptomyces nojiriensis]
MSHARPALRRPEAGLALALAFAAAVAVFFAVFLVGRANTPDYTATLFGQADTDAMRLKAQLATGVLALAALQLVLALWMYGRLPGVRRVPGPVPLTHRIVGVVLFALSIPITVHCIQAYGVQLNGSRAAVHSIAGCFFYGAFAAKVLLVRSRRLPGWALPLAGGALVVVVVVLWYTSALWFFNGNSVPVLSLGHHHLPPGRT